MDRSRGMFRIFYAVVVDPKNKKKKLQKVIVKHYNLITSVVLRFYRAACNADAV